MNETINIKQSKHVKWQINKGLLDTYIYIYLVKVANLAVECSMPYKQNVV